MVSCAMCEPGATVPHECPTWRVLGPHGHRADQLPTMPTWLLLVPEGPEWRVVAMHPDLQVVAGYRMALHNPRASHVIRSTLAFIECEEP